MNMKDIEKIEKLNMHELNEMNYTLNERCRFYERIINTQVEVIDVLLQQFRIYIIDKHIKEEYHKENK